MTAVYRQNGSSNSTGTASSGSFAQAPWSSQADLVGGSIGLFARSEQEQDSMQRTAATSAGDEPQDAGLFFVEALYGYSGEEANHLNFEKNDLIEVWGQEATGWWDGFLVQSKLDMYRGKRGWFPSNYVKRLPDEAAISIRRMLEAQNREAMPEEPSTNSNSLENGDDADMMSGPSLDILLGRKGGDFDPSDLEQVLRWGAGNEGDQLSSIEDLTSFSTGGDIFGEIAAAAAADNRSSTISNGRTESDRDFGDDSIGGLLSAHNIADSQATPQAKRPVAGRNDTVDADWVPKVSTDGRIFYYNTRTGDSAFDLPSPDSSSVVSKHVRSDSGTGASDKTKWLSGGTTASDAAHPRDAPNSTAMQNIPSSSSAPSLFHQSSSQEEILSSNATSRSDLFRPNERPFTMYSDDSALDADFAPSRGSGKAAAEESLTLRKTSLATVLGEKLVLQQQAQQAQEDYDANQERLRGLLLALAVPRNGTLAQLEKACMDALAQLSQAVQTRPTSIRKEAPYMLLEVSESMARKQLEGAAIAVNTSVRQLLSGTDVILDQPTTRKRVSGSSINSSSRSSLNLDPSISQTAQQTLPVLDPATFQPLVMKITATESKLMLCVRTMCGLLDTSPEDERAVDLARDAEGLTAEEIATLIARRLSQLTTRREIDAKLRYDLLVQIRTLGDAISNFVSRAENFASRKGVPAKKEALTAPRRVSALFETTASDLLLPASVTAGAFRGHGFGGRASLLAHKESRSSFHQPPSYHSPASVRDSIRQTEPSRPLTLSTLDTLRATRKALLDDLSTLRTIFQTLLGSHSDDKRLKLSLLPTVSTQALHFINRLSRLLREVEDVDIAGRLDVKLDLETYAALTGETGESVIAKGVLSRTIDLSPTGSSYEESLHRSTELLTDLSAAKQPLYTLPSTLLSVMQALSALPTSTHSSPAYHLPSDSLDSPLKSFSAQQQATSYNIGSILSTLSSVETDTLRLLDILSMASTLADEQASAPVALRRANLALRADLASTLAPNTAASSAPSYYYNGHKRGSNQMSGGLGLEDENAEELEISRPKGNSNGTLPGYLQQSSQSSFDRSTVNSAQMHRTPSVQSSLHRQTFGRPSRSGSVAESFVSDGSRGSGQPKRDAQEDLRNAMQDAGLADNASPTNHSPSKSKLKQFFGADAPGQNIHRPPTANREVPSFLQPDYTHDQISYANDGSIRAGTLHALVCRMTNHMSADRAYNDAFLMTYRTFCDSQELLDRLKSRYNLEPPAGIKSDDYKLWVEQKQKLVRIRVVSALRSWITDYLYDDDDALFDQVSAFAVILPTESSQQLARMIERRKMTGAPRRLTASISGGTAPQPIVPRNLKKIKFLDVDPLEIARQLTIMDSKQFAKITVDECLSKAWPKKFNKDMPNFRAIADMSNAVTGWVAMTIVLQPDMRRRAGVIKHFIAIADKCRSLSNFTTLMQIVAGLNSGAIYRLKRTWELVNQRSMSTLTFLGNLMSPENNHALYRDALRLVGSPCVPFLGVYFTDWVMSGEANKDMLRDKPDQINFAKRARVAESIQQIQMNQATPYNLTAVPALIKWINEELVNARNMAYSSSNGASPGANVKSPIDVMTKAYDLSLKIEPREREDERIARLLSESGFL